MTEREGNLPFITGLRGLAALYVVIHHAYMEVWRPPLGKNLPFGIATWLRPLEAGHFAVGLFLVISGFCLMQPVSKRRAFNIQRYFKRRAGRILPPYFAALVMSLVLIALAPGLRDPTGVRWDVALPAFDGKALASHLLLVHNLWPGTMYKINPPFWSIAVEWQIYFLYPLLILPLSRKIGALFTALLMIPVSLAPHFLLSAGSNGDWTFPWYLALFAFGCAASELAVLYPQLCRRYAGWVALIAFLFLCRYGLFVPSAEWNPLFAKDIASGFASAGLLAYLASAPETAEASPFWNLPPVRGLGEMSYSLYLVHFPLLSALSLELRELGIFRIFMRLGFQFMVGVPLALAAGYGFYLLVERPTLIRLAWRPPPVT